MTELLPSTWLDAESVAELTPDCESRISSPDWTRVLFRCPQPARLAMRTRCVDCGAGRITLRCSVDCAPKACPHCKTPGGSRNVVVLSSEAL